MGDFLPDGEGDRLLPDGERGRLDSLDNGGGDRLDNWGLEGCADASLDFLCAGASDWVFSSSLFG